jgi:hypothetical protein
MQTKIHIFQPLENNKANLMIYLYENNSTQISSKVNFDHKDNIYNEILELVSSLLFSLNKAIYHFN